MLLEIISIPIVIYHHMREEGGRANLIAVIEVFCQYTMFAYYHIIKGINAFMIPEKRHGTR